MKPSADHTNDYILEQQFSEIFCTYEHRLYTLALRLTKSDQSARDIIQEVFMKLWENRSSIHAIDNMEAWLYRLVENKSIDFLRKVAASDRLKESIWINVQQMMKEADEWLIAKEYNQVIQRAINELPPQRKIIYRLHKEEGMNYREIANELNISRHTVKNQLYAAVQSLRRFLARNMKLLSILF